MAGKRSSPSSRSGVALLGDIGGTNARFALLARGRISDIAVLEVADYSEPHSAIEAFLGRHAPGTRIDHACLDIAGPIKEGHGTLTNGRWVLDTADLRRRFKLKSATLINDFEAIAWCLPQLAADDLHYLGGPTKSFEPGPMAAIGPGTGLGVGCLVPEGKSWRALASEGGHATLAAADDREAAVKAIKATADGG